MNCKECIVGSCMSLLDFLYLMMFFPVVLCLICISFWYFAAVEKALLYLDRDELPPHWDRDLLFGMDESSGNSDSDGGFDSDVRKFYTLVTDWLLHGVYQINPKRVLSFFSKVVGVRCVFKDYLKGPTNSSFASPDSVWFLLLSSCC